MKQKRLIQRAAKHEVDKQLGRGLAMVGSMMRQRPRWCPLWVWMLPYRVVFKRRASSALAAEFRRQA